MNYKMSPHVLFCKKFTLTVVTIELLFTWILHCSTTCMNLQMIENVIFCFESFRTYLTFQVTFFRCMYSQMFFVTEEWRILFSTSFLLAGVHFFLWTMDLNVIFQVVFSMKRSVTNCTTKWFSIGVYQSMPNELEFWRKHFSAMIAFIGWCTQMALLVFSEFFLTSEIFLAQVAGVNLFRCCSLWWWFASLFHFDGNRCCLAFRCLKAWRTWLIRTVNSQNYK